jgi:addiction module RelE/StbE family toxin
MRRYILRPSFDKNYKKLTLKVKLQFKVRRDIFLRNPFNPILNNHSLHGEYDGCSSINITGDYRAVYYMRGDMAIFIRIGTHHELYS